MTMKPHALLLTIALATTVVTPAQAQSARGTSTPAPAAPQRLVLRGLDGHDHIVTPAEFAKLPRHDTTVTSHNVTGKYSGVLLTDLLALVHAPAGDSLRGKALATYIMVEGSDDYRVTFSLADFDPGYTDRIALLADQKDGAPLPATEGPYHLIVPSEKRPARWVRNVVRIEVRRVP
jgi:hypothetical protein